MTQKKVCHLTSVHQPFDTRIFHKECKTLRDAGYDVVLVAPHTEDEEVEGIKIRAVPKPSNRRQRIIETRHQVMERALDEDALVYHFHDPELIPVGLALKRRGKKVIYDVHEEVPKQILSKEWIPGLFRPSISRVAEFMENYTANKFDAVVTAAPILENRFSLYNPNTITLNNYPILSELYIDEINWESKAKAVCYIGSITRHRGIFEIVKAIGRTDLRLILAGTFKNRADYDEVSSLEEWKQVEYLGRIDRGEVRNVLQASIAGLAIMHPIPNYINGRATKIFEYMAAGIPVITSDFPVRRKIIEDKQCGICVDPLDVTAIVEAIQFIADSGPAAKRMGENGRRAVKSHYNWETESIKLLMLYATLIP